MLDDDAYRTGAAAVLLCWVVVLVASGLLIICGVPLGIFGILWGGFAQLVPTFFVILRFHFDGRKKARLGAVVATSMLFSLTAICSGVFYLHG